MERQADDQPPMIAVTTSVVIDAPPERRGELVALIEAHGGVRELSEERRSLEDVFLDLTGRELR